MASAAIITDSTLSYVDEQRKLEQLQLEFRNWLETKEDIVRLADQRDQLLAFLDAKYGYCADAVEVQETAVADPLLRPGHY